MPDSNGDEGLVTEWVWVRLLRNAAATGEPLDLSVIDLERRNGPMPSPSPRTQVSRGLVRNIPASALRRVLTSRDLSVDSRGLEIKGAWFNEPLGLDYVSFQHPFGLVDCLLDAELALKGASVLSLNLNGSHVRNVQMDGSEILGPMFAGQGFDCQGGVSLRGCRIRGHLNLNGATIRNSNADAAGDLVAVNLAVAEVAGGVVAGDGFEAQGEFRAYQVKIEGQLNLDGAKLHNPEGDALSLDGAQISGRVLAGDGFEAKGQVRARLATIKGQLSLDGAKLHNPEGYALSLDGVEITGGFFAGNGFRAEGEVRAVRAAIGKELRVGGAKLVNPNGTALNLSSARIAGSFFAGRASESNGQSDVVSDAEKVTGASQQHFIAEGELQAAGAEIGGSLILSGASLLNPGGHALDVERAEVGGSVIAEQCFVSDGGIRAVGIKIGQQLVLEDATLCNYGDSALNLDGAHVAGSVVFGASFTAYGEVRAAGATVGGRLLVDGASLRNPNGRALKLDSSKINVFKLQPDKFEGSLHLYRSEIGDLWTRGKPPGPLEATGWVVGDLHGSMRRDWKLAREWLETNQEETSGQIGCGHKAFPIPVQPWHALADVYDRNGDPAAARRLRFVVANHVTGRSPWYTQWVRGLYWLVAGNGYYPLIAAVWLVVLLWIGCVLVAWNREDIVPTDQVAAETAVLQYFNVNEPGVDQQERAKRQEQAKRQLPVTAETPCAVHPNYPCMTSFTFAVNSVLPPAGSINGEWVVASDATVILVVGLPLLKLLSWALAAMLLAGVTGLLRRN